MAATRADVARAAGVSPSTVTYVLSGQRSTSSSTRERVMRAVRELDYHPNIAARSLASPVLRTIGVLFRRQRSTIDANDLDYVDGVRRALTPSGIQVVIPVMTSSAPLIELRSLVRSGALGGVVLMDVADGDEREAMLLEEKVPTVLIGSSDRAGGAPGIDADFAQMARAGVDHLSELGHRRIVALMRETASDDAHARQDQARELLRAAQVFGARHGIPVLLMSTVRSGGQNVLQFHQFGLDRDVRRALLRATGYCLDRLDLLTAARLLALGDPAMEEQAGEARALADELVKAVQTEDIDGCAGVILGVMDAVGRMIDHVPPDARARLATIIGELLNPAPESKRTSAFREPRILALADGQFDQRKNSVYTSDDADLAGEGAGALLRLLVRVRNKVTINHGSKGLPEATEQVLEHYRRESRCTYARLVERAVTAVESNSGAVAGDWGSRLGSLRKRVGALEDVSYG